VKNLVKHLRQPSRTALIALITLASSIAASDALALQDIEVTPDGMSMARISLHEATRIRVDGLPITQIYGSGVQDAKSNPAGSLIVQPLGESRRSERPSGAGRQARSRSASLSTPQSRPTRWS
jgi:hypothetical protein